MERSGGIITPLNEKNYATWKMQTKIFLMREGLFSIVDGSEVEPTNVDGLAKYKARKNRALGSIVLAVKPRLLYLLGDPTDAKEVWDILQETFQSKSWANRLRLKKKLYSTKLLPGEDMQNHLKTFIEIFDELAIIGDALPKEDKVICLLASLPETYSTLVTALEATEEIPSWSMVTDRLLHENF